jgi:hypothetical protein
MAVTPVRMFGGREIVSVEAVTSGMSVIEFFGPGEKGPRGRLGRRSRKRQRVEEVIRTMNSAQVMFNVNVICCGVISDEFR